MNIQGARWILSMEPHTLETLSVKDILNMCDACWEWEYDGSPDEPHAILTSGLHSDGYFNLNAVLQFPNLSVVLAKRLVDKLYGGYIYPTFEIRDNIDAVVSSSFAAITFGQVVADKLGAMFVFTEKQGDEQIWSGRFELPKETQTLQVEELITSLGTVKKVREAVLKNNPYFVNFCEQAATNKGIVATIIHRPANLAEPSDYKIMALVEQEVHNWKPEECPLCKKDSRALRPKQNWALLKKQSIGK